MHKSHFFLSCLNTESNEETRIRQNKHSQRYRDNNKEKIKEYKTKYNQKRKTSCPICHQSYKKEWYNSHLFTRKHKQQENANKHHRPGG